MDLPPSGWYPDPYGVPGLLRWWDGSTWTQHTHPDSGTQAPDGAEPTTTVQQTTVQPPVQPTTVQSAVQPSAAQPTTVQPAVQPSARPTVQPTTVQPAVQPTTMQPPVQPTAVQPTTHQPAVTRVQPAGGQPAGGWPAEGWPAGAPSVGGPPPRADANGTQVLFLGDDAWTTPGGPGGAAQGSRYGYYRAQRRRRMWLMGGLVGAAALALALVALVVNSLGQSPTAQTTTPTPTAPVAAAATPSPSPSPTPSSTPSATAPGSRLTDGQSGLSYTQLSSPWQPNCPSGLNIQNFTWTAGESAVAGQINGGQTTWYGDACSGPLPQQYGYNGVADLENTATNLANTFNGTYYNVLSHNFQQEVSQPVQISGHPGWEVKFLVTYTNAQQQGLSWTDELGAVVVTDLGTGVPPAVFYTSIPGNLGENNVDSLVSSLQVSSVPTQGGSPAAGSPAAGSPAAGSPTSGGNNGNGDGHHHGN